ncbi:MAG: HD-GYP domain-containing protein [Gammaproteobacteria bacterium]|nr:HD-GYP domain-containing protein [Gammaproteobacteria bacterium]
MYIHDLDISWIDHPFLLQQFLIKDGETITKIVRHGIDTVYIDTQKGGDIPIKQRENSEALPEVEQRLEQLIGEIISPVQPQHRSSPHDFSQAKEVLANATAVVEQLFDETRDGLPPDCCELESITGAIIRSVIQSPYALSGLSRFKVLDRYTAMHSVSVAALSASFGRYLGLTPEVIAEITRGALLHDIGKALIPKRILKKTTPPTDAEFRLMRGHVQLTSSILEKTVGTTPAMVEFIGQHHERCNGSGYPERIRGTEMGTIGKMAAIIDVFDAVTSRREYRPPWSPTHALKKLLEWSPDYFDSDLVHQFIRFQGIFPVGTLVEMRSGCVGIITAQSKNLKKPVVTLFLTPQKTAMGQLQEVKTEQSDETILTAITAERYNIDEEALLRQL